MWSTLESEDETVLSVSSIVNYRYNDCESLTAGAWEMEPYIYTEWLE